MILRYLVFVAFVGCVTPPLQQGGTTAPAGCYSVTTGEWSQARITWRVPETIRLDSAESDLYAEAGETWFILRPDAPTLSTARGGGGSVWQPMGPDSVQLIWVGDYEQLSARLELQGGRMQGVVRGSTDVIRPTELLPWAPVDARQVPCPTGL